MCSGLTPVKHSPAYQRSAAAEACRRGRWWRDGGAGRRWRRRSGKGATGRLLEGSNCVLAAGQVVERLTRVARCVQACPAHKYVRPTIAHFKLEQLLLLVLGHAVRAGRWRWWAGIRVAAEAVRSSEVGAQAFDFELGEDAPRRGNVERVLVWRSAREDPEGTHPPRREQRARREGRVLRVQQHLVPHSELLVPPGGVELLLAPG